MDHKVRYLFLNGLLIIVFNSFTLMNASARIPNVESSTRQIQANQQTQIAITSAESAAGKALEMQLLLPEGFKINGRIAKLIKLPAGTNWYLAFEEALTPDLTNLQTTDNLSAQKSLSTQKSETGVAKVVSPFAIPMEVLPGYWLDTLIKEVGNQVDMSADFHVRGEVTTYHKRNYILPTFVAQPPVFGKEFAEQIKTKPTSSLNVLLGAKAKTEQKASEKQKADKSLLPEHLRQILSAIQESRTPPEIEEFTQGRIRMGITGVERSQTQSTVVGEEAVWKEGHVIVDREGRFQYEPESDRWTFHFEADGKSMSEPPVMLHPCQLLEAIEKITRQTTRLAKFRVTGQISLYQGRNYMLVRMVHKVYDSGNLGK